MRKCLYIVLCFAIFFACTPEQTEPKPDPGNKPPVPGAVTFEAKIMPGGSASDDLSPVETGAGWSVGDRVQVFSDNSSVANQYEVTKTADDIVAGLTGGLEWSESGGSRTFYAYRGGAGINYPRVAIPGPGFTTTGLTGDHLVNGLLLVASPVTTGPNGDKPIEMQLFSMMSVVEFRIVSGQEGETLEKITLTAANKVFAVDGTVDITASGLSFGKIVASTRSNSASLDISGAPVLPDETSGYAKLLLPIAAEGNSGELTVTITTNKGEKSTKVNPVTFAPRKHYVMTTSLQPWVDNYPRLPELSTLGLGPDANGETVLDFSRVGYKWGDEPIPTPSVVETLSPPANGADAAAVINAAIKRANTAGGGAVLLKAGLYNVATSITFAGCKNVVLRGEGSDETTGTRIIGTSTDAGFDANGNAKSILIKMQGSGDRTASATPSAILDDYVPAGQFWVRVADPKRFAVGQDVAVKRTVTQEWINALGMKEYSGWSVTNINQKEMERVVTKIDADTLWFENPLSICIETKYGGGTVFPYTYSGRIEGCGVENLFLGARADASDDEKHHAAGIYIDRSQHCWVRNVVMKRFSFTGVTMLRFAKNITVENCKVLDMRYNDTGSRGYSLFIKGQLCLVKDCYCEYGRHSYSTASPTTNGPNVFVNCESAHDRRDNGPHQRLATGTLYDNCKSRKQNWNHWSPAAYCLMVRTSDGHGWTEINGVFWNVNTDGNFCVQRPPVSGNNYAVGCVGVDYGGYLPSTPAGKIVKKGTPVKPGSLYDAQLALRKSHRPGGVMDVQ